MRESRRETYAARATGHAAARDRERQTSTRLARLRLATFLSGLASLVWGLGFDGGSLAFTVALLLLLAFAVLVAVHARVEERVQVLDALRTVNTRGVARIDRDWDTLPASWSPLGFETGSHPYATDLDLFGRASVFQLLGPGATTFGSSILAGWLSRPAMPSEILARQAAVVELEPLDEWRERLAAFGVLAGNSRVEPIDGFLQWAAASKPPLPAYDAIRLAVYGLLLALWAPLLLHLTGVVPNGFWAIPLVAGVTLSFFTAGALSKVFEQAGAGERTIRQYAGVLEHIDSRDFTSPHLAGVKQRLTVSAGAGHTRPATSAHRRKHRLCVAAHSQA